MLFFKGDSAIGNNGHDDLAREIAMAGKDWSQTFWRREDLIAYQFRQVWYTRADCALLTGFLLDRLFLEYARLMSSDQSSMNYEG